MELSLLMGAKMRERETGAPTDLEINLLNQGIAEA